jgi:hypothetical protein
VRIPHSRNANQLVSILEALARIHHSETLSISKFVRQEAPNLPWGTTLLVISAQPNDDLVSTLLDLRRPGRSTALIKIGGGTRHGPQTKPQDNRSGATHGGRRAGELPVYHIPDDVAWKVIQSIGIQGGEEHGRS